MNVKQLSVFITICEEQSFTKAAARLSMTQPAVSHVVSDLEAECGVKLFDRLGKRIHLTGPGLRFAEKCQKVLEAYADLEETVRVGGSHSAVRLGACITIANTWLPQLVCRYQAEHNCAGMQVQVGSAAIISAALKANELDMAFLEGEVSSVDKRELVLKKVSSYPMVFLCSRDHPFAERELVAPEELIQQPMILREKGSAIRDALDSALLLRHLVAEPWWESVNSQSIIKAVKKNLGVTLLPQYLLTDELQSRGEEAAGEGGLASFSVAGLELFNNNYVAVHKDKYWTKPMEDLAALAALTVAEPRISWQNVE